MNRKLLLFALMLGLGMAIIAPEDFDVLLSAVKEPYYASKISMGSSFKQNNLSVYSLSKIKHTDFRQLNGSQAIAINSYMHAREPYSVELVHKLFQLAIKDNFAQSLGCFLNKGAILFFPFVNIDGFHAYIAADGQHKNQMRKNMNGNQSKCPYGTAGVDINRNFPADFGTVRESSIPCGEEFHGLKPFSQPQAQVFESLFKQFTVIMAVDVHSYGNEWIYPYASDATDSKLKRRQNYPIYQAVVKRLKQNNRTIMSCWQSLKYVADGVYIDWAADQGALSLAYEVGRNFNADFNINQEIARAVIDFGMIFDILFPETAECAEQRKNETLLNNLSHPYKSKTTTIVVIVSTVLVFTFLFWTLYSLSRKQH